MELMELITPENLIKSGGLISAVIYLKNEIRHVIRRLERIEDKIFK